MQAAYYERKGNPKDVLQLGELPEPVPGPGEVRVRVRVSAVNPSDTKTRQGWGGQDAMPFPRIIPHNDGAGEIDRVGPGVPAARVGERVWVFEAQRDGRAFGTAAQFVVVPAWNAVKLGEGVSFDAGASLGVPGMTAHHLLFAQGPIHGQTVLVQGGAGSVGHLAVQLARWAGARVIATAGSESQAAVARECGAHHVVNYKTADVVAEIQRLTGEATPIDRIVEVAFARNFDIDAQLIRPSGVISSYMVDEERGRPPALELHRLMYKDVMAHLVLVYAMSRHRHEVAMADLAAALRDGALRPRIAKRFPLAAIAEAHVLLGTAGAGGKVVLDVP